MLKHQGAKTIIFTACHSGKQKQAFSSPDIISTSPQTLFSRIDFTVLLLIEFLKKHDLPIGQVTSRIHLVARQQNPLAPGYWTLLSLHTENPHTVCKEQSPMWWPRLSACLGYIEGLLSKCKQENQYFTIQTYLYK